MIRRLLLLAAAVYGAVILGKAASKRAADRKTDRLAEATWASEGGTPAPDPVDTPAAI